MEEKKVTGIDLEELKKAREEMMAEMGIASSESSSQKNEEIPIETNNNASIYEETIEESKVDLDEELFDMIDNFIASANDVDDGLLNKPSENDNNRALTQENKINNSIKRNLSHYDVFAPYEINSPKQSQESELNVSENNIDDNNNLIIEEASDDSLNSFENEDSDSEGDVFTEETESQAFNGVSELDIIDSLDSFEYDKIDDSISDFIDVSNSDNDKNEESIQSDAHKGAVIDIDVDSPVSEDGEEIETGDFDFFNLADEVNITTNPENQEKKLEESTPSDVTEELYNEISIEEDIENEIISEIEEKNDIEIENEAMVHISPEYVQNPPKKQDFLPEIDPVSFVNILSMQEFKNSDNFTFVLGRSESGNILFETLKNCYNIAFFANDNSYELLNTMLLSFMLKNGPSEFKLALCDGNSSNNLIYYSQSKYLYGGNIAENEDEILDKLTEILSELESRYRTLAKFNVRSVEEYNILAKNTNTPKLSQILIVIDGYYQLMQSSSFERIKNCLYQILRLGRISGIYAVVVTDRNIDEDIINFNLPSRIGFKCSENDDSISMIGESGISKLSNKNEYLYSSINHENAQHLRQPMISDAIIKILIDNIEK